MHAYYISYMGIFKVKISFPVYTFDHSPIFDNVRLFQIILSEKIYCQIFTIKTEMILKCAALKVP